MSIAREGLSEGRGEGRVGRRDGREREGARRGTRHLPAAEPTPNTRAPPPTPALW